MFFQSRLSLEKRFSAITAIHSQRLDIYYKGITQNLEKRLLEHTNGLSRFTASRGPWKLVYKEEVPNKSSAIILEKSLKKLYRKSILQLIETYSNKNLK